MSELIKHPATNKTIQVLLVDDEQSIVDIIGEVLNSSYDVNIKTAENGSLAFQYCSDQKFDIIITDHKMPEMTGLQYVQAMREECVTNKETPIILVSAYKPEIPNDPDLGKIVTLDKPFDLQNLKDTFEQFLKD